MNKSLLNSLNPVIKLILVLVITFLVFSIVFYTFLWIGTLIFNVSFTEFYTVTDTLDNIKILNYLLAIQSLALFLFPSLAIAWFFSSPIEFFHLNKRINVKNYLITILIVLAAQGVVSLLGYLNNNLHFPDSLFNIEQQLRNIEKKALLLITSILSETNIYKLLLNIIIIAIIPAIGEELFFRGILQHYLNETFNNAHVAIFSTALIFSFVHFEFFTFLPRFFLGLILGYIFYWNKNILLPILAHFTNNFIGIMIYYFGIQNGKTPEELSLIEKPIIWLTLISIVILSFLMYKLKQLSYAQNKNS